MTSKRVKRLSIHVVFALLLLIMSVFGGRYTLSAFADATQYTSALYDLQTDKSFMLSAYPDNPKDHDVYLIQIAESEDNELFVYTYQPCQKTTYLIATELNMSLSTSVDGTDLYPLELINVSGTLCKYKVDGVRVSSAAVRYYNITSIYREWNKDIDPKPDNDNTTNEVSHEVGQLWTVMTTSDGVKYDMSIIDTISVVSKLVGFIRYPNGFHLFGEESCDSHFVAFDTDKRMDKLFEADVSFVKRDAYASPVGIKWGEYKTKSVELTYDETVSNPADGLNGKKYVWKRIERVSDFIVNEGLSDDVKDTLRGKQWVLRFYESAYNTLSFAEMVSGAHMQTEVSEVTILRLKFETNGITYDLGVVDNKQTGPKDPTFTPRWDFFTWLAEMLGIPVQAAKALVYGIAALVVLAIALPVLSLVFPVFGQVLKTVFGALWTGVVWLLKGILWLVLLPFKGIAALVRKIKDKKDGAA